MLINLIGLGLIAFVVLWFWPRKAKASAASGAAQASTIVVDGGVYEPERPQWPAGQPVRLTFLRKDPSPCSQWVVFDDIDASVELPINKAHTLELPALPPGDYPFHCQMNMYRGTLVVR
ncbi:cupredoxin domain-containing protein [Gallaecimonas xiamenensis]|uniref:Plastocyanin domain-containing protein n=1 Tax=Gallaecimonas xiamenensis 3-C-1 TaxID=745411 RepID=K2JWI1_9GAMM|nr:cupredoxin domain-containing protein [Gallaecimonas xiamenensis]EKE69585.1 plastocyanin domain-containing protein [Gallaecimonas xiamenensis 3-C-1]